MDNYEIETKFLGDRKITTRALLFEIQNLNRLTIAKKYRYAQTNNKKIKDKRVKEWKKIQKRKEILKYVCRICYNQNKKLNILIPLFFIN